jgi:hypothetical protein
MIQLISPNPLELKAALFRGISAETDFANILQPAGSGGLVFNDSPLEQGDIPPRFARLTMREGPDLHTGSSSPSRKISEKIINFTAWAHHEAIANRAIYLVRNFLYTYQPAMAGGHCFAASYPFSDGGVVFDPDSKLYLASLSWVFVVNT